MIPVSKQTIFPTKTETKHVFDTMSLNSNELSLNCHLIRFTVTLVLRGKISK